ncbi:DUF4468 domain-containing protein [Cesiribacter sp. SM1]|uniref:DUF4468 domain-containing protein n=1 Tax=Cesiribacter sp. SM1 TaxID=2861196 RepID=UPI001CD26429|nr:DUF4468 domain-containing protein [Cesiribacter sp. SM1]
MKFLGMILLFAFMPFLGEDEPQLPRNSAGKISFEEFVQVDDRGKDALFINAMNFATRVKRVDAYDKKVHADYQGSVVNREGSFYVYTQGLFTPQIHGEIVYNLRLEVMDGGYSYTFTDFVFQYYKKNRYGQYAPVSGKKKPLEKEKFAGMNDTWREHKETTRKHVESHIRALKKKMREEPPGARLNEDEHHDEMNRP